MVYSVEAQATKNYTGTITTNISANIGTTDVFVDVNDASNIPVNSYITIDDETLYIEEKLNNRLTVKRGAYNTIITDHVSGSAVKKITEADNSLISAEDDFGFSGSIG
jgi:hypothetical protein